MSRVQTHSLQCLRIPSDLFQRLYFVGCLAVSLSVSDALPSQCCCHSPDLRFAPPCPFERARVTFALPIDDQSVCHWYRLEWLARDIWERSKMNSIGNWKEFKASYLLASVWHCSSGDGNRWSSGLSFSSSDRLLAFMLCDVIIIMLSVQSSGEVLDVARSEITLVSTIDVLCDTRATQLGATVSSPIASLDVHLRSSSTANGCNGKSMGN